MYKPKNLVWTAQEIFHWHHKHSFMYLIKNPLLTQVRSQKSLIDIYMRIVYCHHKNSIWKTHIHICITYWFLIHIQFDFSQKKSTFFFLVKDIRYWTNMYRNVKIICFHLFEITVQFVNILYKLSSMLLLKKKKSMLHLMMRVV